MHSWVPCPGPPVRPADTPERGLVYVQVGWCWGCLIPVGRWDAIGIRPHRGSPASVSLSSLSPQAAHGSTEVDVLRLKKNSSKSRSTQASGTVSGPHPFCQGQ